MPILLQSTERAGCGATIRLDNGDVVHMSITGTRVSVRQWDLSGLIATVLSNFFGAKLYSENKVSRNAQTAEALSRMFPYPAPGLPVFKNPVLNVFVNAICHCGSADEVRTKLARAWASEPSEAGS